MEYKTDDTYFSAVLIAKGRPLLDIEVEDNIVSFIFENDGQIDDIHRKYDYNNLKVDAKTLAMAIKEQKKRVAKLMKERNL